MVKKRFNRSRATQRRAEYPDFIRYRPGSCRSNPVRQLRGGLLYWRDVHQLFKIVGGIELFQRAELTLQLVQKPSFPAKILGAARFGCLVDTEQYRSVGAFQQVVEQGRMVGFVLQRDQPE